MYITLFILQALCKIIVMIPTIQKAKPRLIAQSYCDYITHVADQQLNPGLSDYNKIG